MSCLNHNCCLKRERCFSVTRSHIGHVTQFKRWGYFHFFRILRSAKPRPMINVILHILELDLVNINVSAKFYQNIPNGLRVKFHCFQYLNLGKTSTNPKCHLTILWATSCQYQCVCKISS